jgi:hypothetical protein
MQPSNCEALFHLSRCHPVVGWTGIGAMGAADEGAILDASYVGRIRARKEAIRAFFWVERDKGAGFYQLLTQGVVFGF